MRIVTSTKKHKLWYQFPMFVEFEYRPHDVAEFRRWVNHFEARYGASSEWRMLEGRRLSTLCFNTNWREERNTKAKHLRIYVKEPKDITWAQLNIN